MARGGPTSEVVSNKDKFVGKRKPSFDRVGVKWASVLLLISGTFGTLYLNLATYPGYGLLSFLQGPTVVFPTHNYPQLLVEVLLFVALTSAAVGFFLLGRINVSERTEMRHLKLYKLSIIFLVMAYVETILALVGSVFIGVNNTQKLPALTFGTGNLMADALLVGALLFLFSFVFFIVAGIILGIVGSMKNAFVQSGRHEFLVIIPLLFGSIFYFPFSIAAGFLGLFTALTHKPYLKASSVSLYHLMSRAGSKFLEDTRVEITSGIVAAVLLAMLFYLSTLTAPIYARGALIFYVSEYLNGPTLVPLSVGILASSAIFIASVSSFFREKIRLVLYVVVLAFVLFYSIYAYILLSLQSASNFIQLSEFQSTYMGAFLVLVGLLFGLIPFLAHFKSLEQTDTKRLEG